ncbi:hypothetical protein [Spiroplasma ixodetis]|uniref:Adhesin P123 n=1 Tax=Spiroplasma ixodetis TaxID=2141 RepID=A0ABM8BYN3_9MOLU|nr:hypothetical protein [Spiroplasma ixodetis]BDT04998.1 hypothetical protein SHM_26440 [Spiroplasma ixodetis]
MINKLWTDVSLENYNNWYPLTGKITETPQQYIQTWPNVNDWFITFGIRAQNDINAYLDFILSKFPFDSFKDELIKETLRDMVYVMVEHWVFNRTPIEFNVDATIQFNNGTQFSANSTPTINVWDLAPSRMKIWARLTELKQIFSSYNDDEIDVEKIDLKAFYTRNQVDELIKEQKEFTLLKQIKLYDDLVDDNENEIYRGPVSKFINKGYVATDYDKETETMILDWPDEIGTLPPEALENNPQVGDFTHAPTCDFSAKQQKRITANENTITKLNSELSKTNESIDDIKNNWFNIETSPLWKKMSSFIPSGEFSKTYLAIWGYIYQPPSTPTDNYIYSDKKTIFNLGGDINRTTQTSIKLDELIIKDNVKVQLLFTKEWNDITVVSNDINYQASSVTLYQYIGKGTPTEFISEDSTEHDYYTKQETNNLLDKKQNIDDNNLQATVKQIVPAINENKLNIDKKQDKLTAGTNITIDENNKISAIGGSTDLTDYYKKEEVDKKLEDKMDKNQFKYAFSINSIGTEIPNLETTNKTVVGAINENKSNIDKKQDKENWKIIGKSLDNRTWEDFALSFNKYYRVFITWDKPPFNQTSVKLKIEFKSSAYIGGDYMLVKGKIDNEDASLIIKLGTVDGNKSQLIIIGGNKQYGNIFSLEELQDTIKIDIQPKLKINSRSLETNEIEENIWDIELKDIPPTPSPSGSNWKDGMATLFRTIFW